MDPLDQLEATIRARRGADPATSYVASLFAKGRPKIAQKLGEEAVECVIAALGPDPATLVPEAADLLYHLVVLLADAGLSLADVRAELARREGLSGHAEKASRTAPGPLPLSGVPADERSDVGMPLRGAHPILSDD
jgi:phosphoribosyl-ATP pyrophosphohydrolase